MSPDITVLVCTYNRAADLKELLESVCCQRCDGFDYEILVVDNNSTDSTRATVRSASETASIAVRYLFEPRQGKSFALNSGLEEAQGELVAVIDDDQLMPDDYLSTVVQAFRDHPGVTFIGGKVLPMWEVDPPSWLTPNHWSPLGMSDYGQEAFMVDEDRPVCLLTCTFRVDDLKSVGGFRKELGVTGSNGIGSTEDAEIQARLWRSGRRGLYMPQLVLRHRAPAERVTKEHFLRWHRGHGRFRALYAEPEAERSWFRLLGVPSHMYRQALLDVFALMKHSIAGGDAAFEYKTRLWFFFGFVQERLKRVLLR